MHLCAPMVIPHLDSQSPNWNDRIEQVVSTIYNTAGYDTTTGDKSLPGTSLPGTSRPGVSRPIVSRPGASHPGVSHPGESPGSIYYHLLTLTHVFYVRRLHTLQWNGFSLYLLNQE
jgi:hypothetical protein